MDSLLVGSLLSNENLNLGHMGPSGGGLDIAILRLTSKSYLGHFNM